jgi:hypothetical protein
MNIIPLTGLVFASLATILGSAKAATLVNDFSGPVVGYYFTDNPNSEPGFSSSATQSAAAVGMLGQVDLGFYTVNFADAQSSDLGKYGYVNAFSGELGSWDNDLGRRVGGNLFSLDNITGFLVSLRREHLNTAENINFYILSDQDQAFNFPINLNLLPASMFMDIAIDLTQYTLPAGMGAVQIAIAGDSSNTAPATYNFSIDSIRAVPEPSSSFLIFSGLSALALLRRRSH